MVNWRANGLEMFSKITVRKFGRMERVMSDTIRMGLRMERGSFFGQKMSFTKESFFRIESKAMEFTIGPMEAFIRANGSTFRWTDKVSLSGPIRAGMSEGTKMGRNTDLECSLIRKAESLMACGRTERSDLLRTP
jgi:hypothetical protein